MRGLGFLVITIVLIGCDAPAVDQKGLTLVDEEWAMPQQTPLSPGFWGGTARTSVAEDPLSKRKALVHTASVSDVLEDESTLKRWPSAVSKLKSPELRGFCRVVAKLFVGIQPGSANPPRYAPRGKMSGDVYWVTERVPKLEPGWVIKRKSVHSEELPLKYESSGESGGGATAKFDTGRLRWDLSSIDVPPQGQFTISFNRAWDSPYSTLPKTAKEPGTDPSSYKMEPVVIAKVATYLVGNASSGEERAVEMLTGWIEGAGKFSLIAPQ